MTEDAFLKVSTPVQPEILSPQDIENQVIRSGLNLISEASFYGSPTDPIAKRETHIHIEQADRVAYSLAVWNNDDYTGGLRKIGPFLGMKEYETMLSAVASPLREDLRISGNRDAAAARIASVYTTLMAADKETSRYARIFIGAKHTTDDAVIDASLTPQNIFQYIRVYKNQAVYLHHMARYRENAKIGDGPMSKKQAKYLMDIADILFPEEAPYRSAIEGLYTDSVKKPLDWGGPLPVLIDFQEKFPLPKDVETSALALMKGTTPEIMEMEERIAAIQKTIIPWGDDKKMTMDRDNHYYAARLMYNRAHIMVESGVIGTTDAPELAAYRQHLIQAGNMHDAEIISTILHRAGYEETNYDELQVMLAYMENARNTLRTTARGRAETDIEELQQRIREEKIDQGIVTA